MRAFLYGLGCAVLIASAALLALLPQLTRDLLLFLLIGAPLSALVPGSWLLLGATAGSWPRPRTGLALILSGIGAGGIALWQSAWLAAAWAALVLLAGLLVTFPPFTPRRRSGRRRPGPVRPPLGRREI